MGIYINKGNENFRRARNGEYVDKSGLIAEINKTLDTERSLTCVTRCRRFGKSMAADMLCAYYDKSCDSHKLFEGLSITSDPSYQKHLNKFPVLKLDTTNFTTRYRNNVNIVRIIQETIQQEVLDCYKDIMHKEGDDLMETLIKANILTGEKFIFIIDEWDAILREYSQNEEIKGEYVDFLRRLFKGDESKRVFADVLTVMIHLGYLGYDKSSRTCYIPNKEIGLGLQIWSSSLVHISPNQLLLLS